jgi:hypothetical protein
MAIEKQVILYDEPRISDRNRRVNKVAMVLPEKMEGDVK